jgi:hypothetical protein
MFRTSLRGLVAIAAVLLCASTPLLAQSPHIPVTSSSATVAPSADAGSLAGPRITSVGVQRLDVAPGGMMALQDTPRRRDFAWMVLGGATVIVGSIVGGDGGTIIMITGGVIGLVGLWRYLQYS